MDFYNKAGKDVAFSESAGKYLFTTLACNKRILIKEWSVKLSFCFLMKNKTKTWYIFNS